MQPRLLSIALALSVASALGCGDKDEAPEVKTQHDYTLEVDVQDSQGNTLPRVSVTVDGKVVGLTDADGKFTATLTEYDGVPVTLGVIAPDGYYFPEGTDTISETLRTTTVNKQKSGVPVFLSAKAESLKKDYFFWVKTACDTECSDWPILLNGEEIARTNSLGYAHFSITDQPETPIELTIDSGEKFKPADPTYEVVLDFDSTVYRIEQPFTDPTKPKPRKRVSRPAGKGKKKKAGEEKKAAAPDPDAFVEPVKKKKDDGVIDLFGP